MSGSSLTDFDALFGQVGRPSISQLVVQPVKIAAFWAAVVLPFLHLSLLVAGLDSDSTTLAFVGLITLNVVALYVGHPHGSE